MPRWLTLGAVSLVAVLTGCVPLPPRHRAPIKTTTTTSSCGVGTAWSTAYASSRVLGALPAGHLRVLSYRLTVSPAVGHRCASLVLNKRLTLLRGTGPLQLVEVRDFYKKDRLVAQHRGFIGREIPESGSYKARLTLPIPASAPLGHYRVVSLLYARWGGHGQPLLIARAQAAFVVQP